MANKISDATKEAIRQKSVQTLPNRPSEGGFKASDIKMAITAPMLNGDNSLVGEINRIVDEFNAQIGNGGENDSILADIGAVWETIDGLDGRLETVEGVAGDNEIAISGIKNGTLINSFSEIESALSAKENKINSSHKISADHVDDTSTTHKFVTSAEKTQIQTNKDAIGTSSTSGTILYKIKSLEDGRAASIDCSVNTSTYVLTIKLKNASNEVISTGTIDLPIESLVMDVDFDEDTDEIVIYLKNGNTTRIDITHLVSGLQTEITNSNKLDSDLVTDTDNSHKFVTASEKSQISTNASNITSLQSSKQDNITAGTGLSKSGATLNHSNSVTAATKGSATAIPQITYDAQGHITGVTEKTVYPPTTAGSSNQYWKSDGSGVGAWATPSSTPSSGSNTLISSGAVYSALQNYETTSHASSTYQTKINSSNKVSADNVDDTSTTNKFVSAADKTAIAKIGDENTADTILYRIKAIEDDISAAIDIIDDI